MTNAGEQLTCSAAARFAHVFWLTFFVILGKCNLLKWQWTKVIDFYVLQPNAYQMYSESPFCAASPLAIILQCLINPSCQLFSLLQQHWFVVLQASPRGALPPWPPAFVATAFLDCKATLPMWGQSSMTQLQPWALELRSSTMLVGVTLSNAKIAATANDKKMLLDLMSRSQWVLYSSYCRPDKST